MFWYLFFYFISSRLIDVSKEPYRLYQRVSKKPKIGTTTIEGYAWPIHKTLKDVDGKECVLLTFEVQVKQRIRRVMYWLNTVRTFRYQVPFLVISTDGIYLIDPPRAKDYEFELDAEPVEYPIVVMPENYKEILDAVKQTKKPLLHENYVLAEKKILMGAKVLVNGVVSKATSESIEIPGDIHKYSEFIKRIETEVNFRNIALDLDRDGTITNLEEKKALNKLAKASKDRSKQFIDITAEINYSDQNKIVISDTFKSSLLRKYDIAPATYFTGVALRIISITLIIGEIIGFILTYLKK